MFQEDITIAITSCGRITSLKKTIHSIEQTIDLSKYKRILTEDSTDEKVIQNIKHEQTSGFLKGWEVHYTGRKGTELYQSHHNALNILYKEIDTKYVFHCEDDQIFKKTDFDYIEYSYNILENFSHISLFLLRDVFKDFKLKKTGIMKDRYYEMLTDSKMNFQGKVCIYMNPLSCFSLQPGLRETQIMKEVMFGHENYVDETLISARLAKKGYQSIILKEGVYNHISPLFNSTKNIKNLGLFTYIYSTLSGTIRYRGGLCKKYIYSNLLGKKK